jgi:hypothetical protein
MPFTNVRCGVAGGFQRARQGWRRWIQEVGLATLAIAFASLKKARDSPASWMLARDEAAARR